MLVDEYQDTNHAQYRLLQLLAGEEQQPDASSATTTSPSTLPRRRRSATSSISRATSPSAEVVKLEQNYRSTQTILASGQRA